MERPEKTSGEQGEYIDYLEGLLSKYESKKTSVQSYFGLKTIVDDLNSTMINGIEVEIFDINDPTKSETKTVPVISSESLSSKDDKILDRIFKFIGELSKYNSQLQEMEEKFAPEIKKEEKNYGSELEEVIFESKK